MNTLDSSPTRHEPADPALKPIRRIVTGVDSRGGSCVAWDGPAPGANPNYPTGATRGHTDLWVWTETPPRLDEVEDASLQRYDFPGPPNGGHLRAVQSRARPADYDRSKDRDFHDFHEPLEVPTGRRWDRGGRSAFAGDLHKTETVDFAILVEGERVLGLDSGEVLWKPGDVVIDVAAWHNWSSPRESGIVLFDLISAKFIDGHKGLAQGHDKIMVAPADRKLPPGVKGTRRIVIADREPGRSYVVSDGYSPDVHFDAARPGFASTRLWVVDSAPAKVILETLHLPYGLLPPRKGATCSVLTIPPDDAWAGRVGAGEVATYFKGVGAPGASVYSTSAPHPYMQKTRTLDFCLVIDGELTLVLETQEVKVKKGEIVVQRGTAHAWSNRTARPAVLAVCSHDAS